MRNPRESLRRRISVMITCAIFVFFVPFLVHTPKASATPDIWIEDTYADFKDSFDRLWWTYDVLLKGTGPSAYIELKDDYLNASWHDMEPENPPTAREEFGFTFDSTHNVAILFGGAIQDSPYYLNDTWEYSLDTNTWSMRIPHGTYGNPVPRSFFNMAYDSTDNVVVLFGGYNPSFGLLSDTWEYDYDTNTWTETTPPVSQPNPPAMNGFALTYDSAADRIIVAGTEGDPFAGATFHTWAYDATTNSWEDRAPSPQPDPRFGHSMASNKQVSVLNSGKWWDPSGNETWHKDTWEYNYTLNKWTKYVHSLPLPRIGGAMARFDDRVWLVNGLAHAGNGTFHWWDIWVWLPGWWDMRSLGPELIPPPSKNHRMTYDSIHDAMILFGGTDNSTHLDKTWVYAYGYSGNGYYTSFCSEDSEYPFYYDSGSLHVKWLSIWWNDTSQPPVTKLKFQLNSDPDGDPVTGAQEFVGPDGTNNTYYTTPGQLISTHHDNVQFIRYKAYLDGVFFTPKFDNVTIVYSVEGPPYIKKADPADGETDVPLWKNITVVFSETMNTNSAKYSWIIDPDPCPSLWIEEWSTSRHPNDTLTLKHPVPFTENEWYTVEITYAEDLEGNALNTSIGEPNPWQFQAQAINPWLEWTNPYDGEIGVETNRNITIQFNEPMIHTSVNWVILPLIPPKSDYTVEWGNSNATLFLNHTDPFQKCTLYDAFIVKGKDLKGNPLDPTKGASNPWTFYTYCEQPYVAFRDPEHTSTGVPLDKNIIITFSEEMDTTTVTWLVSTTSYEGPSIDLGWSESWAAGNTVLNISHSTLFNETTKYFVNVTYGEDLDGNPLNRTADLPKWYFITGAVGPWIVKTNPYHEEPGVPTDKDIVVTFSEPMKPSVLWNIAPDPGGWSEKWSGGNTILTLTHSIPFLSSTTYTVTITHAEDLDGNPLDSSKGAENPWEFTTRVEPPYNLRVERFPPDIVIIWDKVPGADGYRVYESQDRFTWPWTLLGTVYPPQTYFTHIGAHDNGTTHFYIVRAFTFKGGESTNSTMGVKAHLPFSKPLIPELTDVNWLSLPYKSIYKKASDIASELTEAKIRVVGKWNPVKQRAITYTYAKDKWKGVDFDINPGEGLFIAGLQKDFDWVVSGTDLTVTLNFTYYPEHKRNINWISIPYTGIYDSASSMVADIEGSLFTPPMKLIEVGKWNPAIQTSKRFYWDGVQWTGSDFTVEPGDGIYLQIVTSFEWPVKLVTPAVP